jgi:antitoxin component of MazEF toxin-antitoxin module
MGKKITVRKSSKSFIITLPKSYCEMIGIKDGSILDCEPFTKDSLILKVD